MVHARPRVKLHAHGVVRTRYADGAEDGGAEEEDEKDVDEERLLYIEAREASPSRVEACQGGRRLARCFGD